jgi:plastocyanin
MAVSVTTIRRWSALAAALLLLSGTLAACGGGSSGSSSTASGGGSASAPPSGSSSGGGASTTSASTAGGGSTLDVSAVEKGGDSLGFSSRQLTARAGTVTIKLANGSRDKYPHGIAIQGNGVDKDGAIVKPGGTTSVTLRLKPGRYTFYCPVKEHEKYGMKGTLTVT